MFKLACLACVRCVIGCHVRQALQRNTFFPPPWSLSLSKLRQWPCDDRPVQRLLVISTTRSILTDNTVAIYIAAITDGCLIGNIYNCYPLELHHQLLMFLTGGIEDYQRLLRFLLLVPVDGFWSKDRIVGTAVVAAPSSLSEDLVMMMYSRGWLGWYIMFSMLIEYRWSWYLIACFRMHFVVKSSFICELSTNQYLM